MIIITLLYGRLLRRSNCHPSRHVGTSTTIVPPTMMTILSCSSCVSIIHYTLLCVHHRPIRGTVVRLATSRQTTTKATECRLEHVILVLLIMITGKGIKHVLPLKPTCRHSILMSVSYDFTLFYTHLKPSVDASTHWLRHRFFRFLVMLAQLEMLELVGFINVWKVTRKHIVLVIYQ